MLLVWPAVPSNDVGPGRIYDMSRFGMELIAASPVNRPDDVAGRVSRKMVPCCADFTTRA